MLPLLVMGPMMVPQPVTVALDEMTRPLAKLKTPPCNWSVAALTPSPTTNAAPFATVMLLAWSVPRLKANVPKLFVRSTVSTVTEP